MEPTELPPRFVSPTTEKGPGKPRQYGNQRLGDSVRTHAGMRMRRFDLAQGARDQEQTMWVFRHPPNPIDKDAPLRSTGMNQVREILPLHYPDLLQSANRIIP